MKINQFCVDCRSAKMEARNFWILILLNASVTLICGFGLKGDRQAVQPTFEDCMKPPTTRHDRGCCRLPRERIWGDLRQSLSLCLKKVKQEAEFARQEEETSDDGPGMVTPEGSDAAASTEVPNESGSVPSVSYSTTPGRFNHRGRPHDKKSLSERFKELFSPLYKEIKSTFRALWQSVVIITDQLHRYSNDSCFMECVFEDQGFLLNKMINKAALLERFRMTLGGNEPWHKTATAAVETCYRTEMAIPSNKTCRSGSEEVFRCIFRQIFFNCPNWAQNRYCVTLKEFYQKCPHGPPPEISDDHSAASSSDEDTEMNTSTESERYTKPE